MEVAPNESVVYTLPEKEVYICGGLYTDKNFTNEWNGTVGTEDLKVYAKYDEFVVFNPATYTGSEGEVVEYNGEKYLKVTVDEYATIIFVSETDLSGCSEFKATAFAEETNENYELCLRLLDANWYEISSILFYGLKSEVSTSVARKAEELGWNTVSETMVFRVLQPRVTNRANGYTVLSDVVIYIGKIVAK